MNHLPNDVLYEIFLYLPFDLFTIRLVNKRWNNISQSRKIENVWFESLPEEIKKLKQTFPETLSSVQSLVLYSKKRYKKQGHVQLQELDLKEPSLNLRYQELSIIPPEIQRFTHLSSLHLHRNNLVNIPQEFFQLTNLYSLSLDYNQITILPKDIGKLVKLEIFNIRHNQLSFIPSEIGQLTKLHALDFDQNPLVSLPKNLIALKNLFYFNPHKMYFEEFQIAISPWW